MVEKMVEKYAETSKTADGTWIKKLEATGDVCRQDFEKYLDGKIPWTDAQEVPKKPATSVTSVTNEPEAAFVNTFDAHHEHISEAEQLQ